jgi:hypothetical protein
LENNKCGIELDGVTIPLEVCEESKLECIKIHLVYWRERDTRRKHIK